MFAPVVLHLNLTSRSSEVRSYEELAPLIGGLGWALALFEKEISAFRQNSDRPDQELSPGGKLGVRGKGRKTLNPKSRQGTTAGRQGLAEPIVFAIGPLSAVFPGCSKTVAVFRSPQNGFLSISLGGGHLARALRFAGYQALVISGASRDPLIVNVDGEQISFEDGSPLMNKEVPDAFKVLFSSEGVPGRRSILTSGLAAEREIAFSSLYIDEFFSFSRGGLGAVFARKNLKGLVVSGGGSEEFESPVRYREVFSTILRRLSGFEELGQQGTLKNLKVEKKISGVPFENLMEPSFDDRHQLSEAFFDSRRLACSGCPVGCVHLTKQNGGYFPYGYDAVAALGPLLGITSKGDICELLAGAYRLGVDPVSLGSILAYLTERGKLAFGNVDTYLTLINALLEGKEDWAKVLRQGLAEGVKTLGSEDFALVLGGLEALPYFNGYATLLSQVLSLSATTEENRGFLLDIDLLEANLEPEAIVSALIKEERQKILVELLVGCGYLSSVFEEPATAFAALEALRVGVKHEELEEAVEQTFRRLLALQKRLGFDPWDVRIPTRFFSIPSPQGILEERKLREMVTIYREKVGWAVLDGPTEPSLTAGLPAQADETRSE